MRLRWLLLFICALLLTTIPLHAQDDWSAWLLENQTNRMILADRNGLVEELVLPLADGYDYLYHNTVVVSPNGNYFAYVVGQSGTNNQLLTIYDFARRSVIGQYPPFDVSYSGIPAFNRDSTQIAFGNSMNASGWDVVIIDLATLAITATLNSTEASAAAVASSFNLTPYFQWFSGTQLGFAMVLSATDATPPFDNFIWDTASGTVTPSVGYGYIGADIHPLTGEVAFPLPDDRFALTDAFMFGHYNTVQVYSPLTRERYPVYADTENSLGAVHFVNNGEYLLISSYDPAFVSKWFVVGRGGNLVGTLPTPDLIADAGGTPDGFIYTSSITATSTVHFVDLSGGVVSEGTPIYDSGRSESLQVVWVGSLTGTAFTAEPFPAWVELADPVRDGEAVADSGPTAPQDATLRVGGQATVRTTEGDALNMRSGAGTQFSIVSRLRSGSVLTLLEGPVSANGFNWWRVRSAAGQEGWVVDSADNEQTLLPGVNTSVGLESELGANPEMASLLAVGDDVIVTLATRGDALRLRNEPGLDGRVISQMPAGTRLRIIDGPRPLDNYTWWQIRTPEGNVGWAAEIIGNERVLVRTTTAAVTNTPPASAAGAPILMSPLPGTILTNFPRAITFTWQAVSGAASYTIEMEGCPGSSGPCEPFRTVSGLGATAHTETFPGDGRGRWRVGAVAPSGAATFSDWWSFSIDTSAAAVLPAPEIISPMNGATYDIYPRTMTLSWLSVGSAASYDVDVQYCGSSDVSTCTNLLTENTSATSYTFDFVGAQPGRWRVRALDGSGVAGTWSEWRMFIHNQ